MAGDAVVLDAGGVLLLPDPDAMRAGLAPFGVRPDDEACRRAHYVSMREVDRIGAPDWPRVDRALARSLGVAEADIGDDLVHAVEDVYLRTKWVAIEGAAEALRGLETAGHPLAVVSNAEGTMADQLRARRICSVDGGDIAHVAIVVDSTVVGVEKPDPAIFGPALRALGAPAERCVYVGDTVHFDVEGARAAGLRPVHVDPYDLCPGTDHPHVTHVAGVADLVNAQ